MQKFRWFGGFLLLTLNFVSCDNSTDPKMQEDIDYGNIQNINYTQHVQPLLNKYCVSCHGAQSPAAGLKLDSWANLVKGSTEGEAVIPFDAENSTMIEMLTKLSGGPHPTAAGAAAPDSVETAFLERWVREGARNEIGLVPFQNATNRLYVCNQDVGIISVISTDAKVVIRNIHLADIGFSASSKPHDISIEPDGQYWYVSLIESGKVLKFNRNYELVDQADFESAGLLAMHPTKNFVYVSHTLSRPNVPPTLATIERSDMQLKNISLPFSRPHALAADHAGRYMYTSSLVDSRLATIDTDLDPYVIDRQFSLGPSRTLVQMNVSPNDQEIYISSQLDNQLLVLDISDPSNIQLIDSVTVGEYPWHPKFTPDGSKVYVGNNLSHTVSIVNTTTRQEEMQIGVGDGSDGLAQPHGLVISPSGNFVYVSNRNKNIPAGYTPRHNFGDNANTGTVVILNTQTNSIEKVIEIEKFPSGMAIYEE
jgi:YVTN family beta-propeller protein